MSSILTEGRQEVYPDDYAAAISDQALMLKTLHKFRTLVSDIRCRKLAKAGLNPNILPTFSVEASLNDGICLCLAHLHRLDDHELDDADQAFTIGDLRRRPPS